MRFGLLLVSVLIYSHPSKGDSNYSGSKINFKKNEPREESAKTAAQVTFDDYQKLAVSEAASFYADGTNALKFALNTKNLTNLFEKAPSSPKTIKHFEDSSVGQNSDYLKTITDKNLTQLQYLLTIYQPPSPTPLPAEDKSPIDLFRTSISGIGIGIALMGMPTPGAQADGNLQFLSSNQTVATTTSFITTFILAKALQAATNFHKSVRADSFMMKKLCEKTQKTAIETNTNKVIVKCNFFKNEGKEIIFEETALSAIGKKSISNFAEEVGISPNEIVTESLKEKGNLKKFYKKAGFDNFLARHVPDPTLLNLIKNTRSYKRINWDSVTLSSLVNDFLTSGANILDLMNMDPQWKLKAKQNLTSYANETILGNGDIRGSGTTSMVVEYTSLLPLFSETDSELSNLFGNYEEYLESPASKNPERTITNINEKDPELRQPGSLFSRIRQAVKRNYFKRAELPEVDLQLLKKRLDNFQN